MLQKTNQSIVAASYGDREEVKALTQRLKVLTPGGRRLSDSEALALAQAAVATQCNPLIGEIWYIPGSGPMVGIKGMRRHADEQITKAGGDDAYWNQDLQPVSPEEAGAPAEAVKDVVAAWKCTITDSVSTAKFQKLFLEMVTSFRDAGDADPVGSARELLGKAPKWVGYGYATKGESSKMNKQQLARKRAEAEAIKQRFDIPFGVTVAAADVAQDVGDWIDSEEVTETENKPSEQEAQAAANLEGIERPYIPEVLRQHVQIRANENQRQQKLTASDKQRGLTASVLTEVFAGDRDAEIIRKMIIKYLTGYDSLNSSNGAPGIYVLALLDWLKPTKDSGGAYKADPQAAAEAQQVYREVLKDSGQIEMEM